MRSPASVRAFQPRTGMKSRAMFLPLAASSAIIGADQPAGSGGPIITVLDPNIALAVTAGWLVLALIVPALFVERAEIGR